MNDIVELTKDACGPCCTCSAPRCPRCKELLVHPRGLPSYCEECGWPDEDFDELYPSKEIGCKLFWIILLVALVIWAGLFAALTYLLHHLVIK
jgi:hypothetical protein